MNESLQELVQLYPQQYQYLKRLIDTGNIHHAYEISSTYGGMHHLWMLLFTRMLLCTNRIAGTQLWCDSCQSCLEYTKGTHPDLYTVQSDNGTIGIDDVQAIRYHVTSLPHIASFRVVSIHNAHFLTITAVNSLLKMLEEPPSSVIILLSTHAPELLLPTLRSRLHVISLSVNGQEQPLNEKYKQEQSWWIEFVLAKTAQRYTMIQEKYYTGSQSREAIHTISEALAHLEMIFRQMYLSKKNTTGSIASVESEYTTNKAYVALKKIEECKTMVDNNVNKKMIFDYLIMTI